LKKYLIAIFFLFLISYFLLSNSSSFIYYSSQVNLSGQKPPLLLDPPPYTYTCTSLTRTRTAITYTDFETFPSGWTSNGGTWSIVSGGYKGNAMQGTDNNGGIGGASQFYYNTRLDTYTSLWVTTKVKFVSGPGINRPGAPVNLVYFGLTLIRSPTNRLYEISVSSDGYLNIWSYGVENNTGWYLLSRVLITGFNINNWYVIVVFYSVTSSAVNISAYLYDTIGNLVAQTSASSTVGRRFTPAFIGLEIDGGNGASALYDDFEIATSDLRVINFNSLQSGMQVQIIDNLNNLVAQGTAITSSLTLNVISDIVVGTGTDGRIIIKYPNGINCLIFNNPTSDAILGGDTYSLATSTMTITIDSTKTSANETFYVAGSLNYFTQTIFLNITVIDINNYYASLILNQTASTISSNFNANITLVNRNNFKSTNITIINGVVTSSTTSEIVVFSSNNYIFISARYSAIGLSSTLVLILQYCTLQNYSGACVQYTIRLIINS
jgi:hypothetical protein